MEKPKCRICGERHWGLCPGTVADVKERVAVIEKATVKLEKPKFDRTAYQREYMRRRRAAKREGK